MDISDIKTLIQLIKSSKPTLFKNYYLIKRPRTKIQELYNGIVNDTFINDEKAASALYNSDPSGKSFMMLRRELFDDLSQSLLFYDFSRDMSHHPWRKILCQRKLLVIQILLSFGLRSIATGLAERLLQDATQLEFLQIEIQCLQILRTTSAINGKVEYFNKYNITLKQKLNLYNEVLKAEEGCQNIEVYLVSTAAKPNGLYEQAIESLKNLDSTRSINSSFEIELYRYRILLYALQMNHEYDKTIEVCIEAENYLLQRQDLVSKSRIAEFKTTALNCCIKIRKFDDALSIGKECLGIYQEGKRNWFNILSRMLKIYTYIGNYSSAMDIYLLGSQNSGFIKLPLFRQELWLIYRGYLSLFIDLGKFENKESGISISDITQSSGEAIQDKKGLNISLLILHILFSINQDDNNQLVSTRIYLFQDYSKRYLNETEHKRTLIFLSMLKLLRKAKYDRKKAEKLARNLYRTLLHEPEHPEHFLESIEIIPYESLWEWILKNTR